MKHFWLAYPYIYKNTYLVKSEMIIKRILYRNIDAIRKYY